MNRRPWPIVLMAVLQFLSPLIYLCVAALFYHLSFIAATNEIFALTPDLRKFEIFVLPLILGVLILLTRKAGYYLVVLGSIYLIARGIMEFFASNETDPVFPLVISNVLCLVVVVTLLRSKTRSVYFNPRLRWWETSPRYVVNFPASVTRVGAKPMKATVTNLSEGGAGADITDTPFLANEIVDLEFQHDGAIIKLKSKVAWQRAENGRQHIGLQWTDANSNAERSKVRRFIRTLKSKKVQTTRTIPPRMRDVKAWFSKFSS